MLFGITIHSLYHHATKLKYSSKYYNCTPWPNHHDVPNIQEMIDNSGRGLVTELHNFSREMMLIVSYFQSSIVGWYGGLELANSIVHSMIVAAKNALLPYTVVTVVLSVCQ